jgi:hypothetical protein
LSKDEAEERSSFLKKRTKKLFPGASHEAAPAVPQAPTGKSFLLLFFKKEALS